MIMPLGTYITPNRFTGLAAVFAMADSAGTMLSRNGNASVAPMPRSTVRRGIAFLEINIALLLFFRHAKRWPALDRPHAERRARDNACDDRRPAVIVLSRVARDLANRRLIVVFEAAAGGIGQQLGGQRPDEIFLVAHQKRAQPFHAFERRTVRQGRRCVDALAVAHCAPLAVGVEILERES